MCVTIGCMSQNNLSPRTRKVLELILGGDADGAEKYVEAQLTQHIADLERTLHEAQHERSMLMNIVGMAKRGAPASQESQRRINVRSPRPSNKDERREIVLSYALEVAKKRKGLAQVKAVVEELREKGVNLGMKKPNTSIGNLLNQSDEWERESAGLFRYVGKQLDLKGAEK